MKTLFVCGTPRSGTTLLAQLLGAHDRIVLGVERYKLLYAKGAVTPDLFLPDRFLDHRPSDTDHAPEEVPESLRKKFVHAEWVGDKYPTLYQDLPGLRSRFPDARFIFIIRNPFEVAMSWQVRAENPEDNWSDENGMLASVGEWNEAIRIGLEAVRTGIPVHFVNYGVLTNYRDVSSFQCLADALASLGLEADESTRLQYVREARVSVGKRRARREPDPQAIAEISKELDHELFARFAQTSGFDTSGILSPEPLPVTNPAISLQAEVTNAKLVSGKRAIVKARISNSAQFPIKSRGRDRYVVRTAWSTDGQAAALVEEPHVLRSDVEVGASSEEELLLTVPPGFQSGQLQLMLVEAQREDMLPAAEAMVPVKAIDMSDHVSGSVTVVHVARGSGFDRKCAVTVRLSNRSAKPWPSKGERPCRLMWRWHRDGGAKSGTESVQGRAVLSSTLAPGESREQILMIEPPSLPGLWTLRITVGLAGLAHFDTWPQFTPGTLSASVDENGWTPAT